jgi:hypothetical protein
MQRTPSSFLVRQVLGDFISYLAILVPWRFNCKYDSKEGTKCEH